MKTMAATATATRQRRGKDEHASKTNKASSSSSPPSTEKQLEQEVNKAITSVRRTHALTTQLHSQWRDHLLRISYLIVMIALHQCSTPIRDCIRDIKSVNANDTMASDVGYDPIISTGRAMSLIGSESLCEIINAIIAVLLYQFLTLKDPHGTFTTWSFLLSSSMVPICVGIYFFTQRHGCRGEDEDLLQDSSSDSNRGRQFPVAIVFHFIVSSCYWFMKMSVDDTEKNLKMVENLQSELKSCMTKSKQKKSKGN